VTKDHVLPLEAEFLTTYVHVAHAEKKFNVFENLIDIISSKEGQEKKCCSRGGVSSAHLGKPVIGSQIDRFCDEV